MLESLHAERKLPLSHWRYRLLHWAFNVEGVTAENLKASPLPDFLYTHFCPLFWITNALVLLSPLIFAVHMCIAVWRIFDGPATLLGSAVKWTWDQYRKWRPAPERKPKTTRKAWIMYRLWLAEAINLPGEEENKFSIFWYNYQYATEDTEAVWRQRFFGAIAIHRAYAVAREAEKAELRAKMIRWVNLSRAILRGAFYAVVALFTLGVSWLAYMAGPAVLSFCWATICAIAWHLWHADLAYLAWGFLMWLGGVLVTWSIIAGIIVAGRWSGVTFAPVKKAARAPFEGVGIALRGAVGLWIKFCVGAADFVKMFYEENCPPVTIVPEDHE